MYEVNHSIVDVWIMLIMGVVGYWRPSVLPPRIRTNSLSGYPTLARSVGLDPAALMAGVGLDIADLDVPDRWIPAAPAARLLDLSAQRAGCPDFGLRLSEFRHLGTLGPMRRRPP